MVSNSLFLLDCWQWNFDISEQLNFNSECYQSALLNILPVFITSVLSSTYAGENYRSFLQMWGLQAIAWNKWQFINVILTIYVNNQSLSCEQWQAE